VTHCTDDDLVLHHYGDPAVSPQAGGHLATCASCRDRLHDLAESLRAMTFREAPDPGDHYGVELWHRLAPRLPRRQPFWQAWLQSLTPAPRRSLAVAAAAAVLLVVGFVAGRIVPDAPPQRAAVEAIDADEARRVLLMSVADHLERSDRVLTDILNASVDGDISNEQVWAADLVADNRFFRQDAVASDEHSVAAVLDELERALLDIVHGPSVASRVELEEMHRRLDSAALPFKVRVLGGELRHRQLEPAMPAAQPSSSRIS